MTGNSGKTICITGGHLTPALAVIEQLQAMAPYDIVFIGRKYALEGDREVSEEYRTITGLQIPFISLSAGRFSRHMSIRSILSLFKVPIGFIQALLIVSRVKPTLVVSFGGYIAAPVVIGASLLGIPAVTHEQTRVLGFTNRIINLLTKKTFVSFPDTLAQFTKGKALYIGLPLRHKLFTPVAKSSLPISLSRPLIYVTGGATGALSLNKLLFPIVPSLLKKFSIIHQTGRLSFNEATKLLETLPWEIRGRYYPTPYLETKELSWVYEHSDLIVGRSGANTVGEIAALGKIALFIPLPWSAGREQEENAKWLTLEGGGQFLSQEESTSGAIKDKIEEMYEHRRSYELNAQRLRQIYPRNAAKLMAGEIIHLVDSLS